MRQSSFLKIVLPVLEEEDFKFSVISKTNCMQSFEILHGWHQEKACFQMLLPCGIVVSVREGVKEREHL